jgi:hypothetical protein
MAAPIDDTSIETRFATLVAALADEPGVALAAGLAWGIGRSMDDGSSAYVSGEDFFRGARSSWPARSGHS